MSEQLIIEPFASGNAYGEPTYAEALTVAASIESYNKMIRTDDSQERVASTKITILPGPVFDEKARITLPSGKQPSILRIDGLESARPVVITIYT